MRKASLLAILLMLAIASAQIALAANNPGHDTLYVLKIGDSNVTGNINISGNVTASIVQATSRFFGPNLDIRGDGTSAGSVNQIIGTSTGLEVSSPGTLILNKAANGGMVYVGLSSSASSLNVSGALYVLSGTATINGQAVCVANGSNCPSALGGANISGTGTANTVAKWTGTGTTLGNSMIYDSGTNIGIGTTSPNTTLHVAGRINVTSGNDICIDASKCLSQALTSQSAETDPIWTANYSGKTGSGSIVYSTNPSLTTPTIGAATATTINGNTITTGTGTLTLSTYTLTAGATGTVAITGNTLAQFASTTSAQLTGILSDEDGSGDCGTGLICIGGHTHSEYQASLGYTPSQAATSTNSVYSLDSRNTNYNASDRAAGLYVDFKANGVDSLTDGGSYHGVLTFRSYGSSTDLTGGNPIQIAYTENGNLWTRLGTGATTWGTWYKIWNQNNDGSGSGLDADQLDGQEGSYYQPASSALTTSTSFTGGDISSGSYNTIQISDDSHSHTKSTITIAGENITSGTINSARIPDSYLLNTGDTGSGNYTFDTDTLHIDSTNDRVGVGTTTPNQKLHVSGSVNVTNNIYITQNISFSGGGYMYDNGTAVIIGHN